MDTTQTIQITSKVLLGGLHDKVRIGDLISLTLLFIAKPIKIQYSVSQAKILSF